MSDVQYYLGCYATSKIDYSLKGKLDRLSLEQIMSFEPGQTARSHAGRHTKIFVVMVFEKGQEIDVDQAMDINMIISKARNIKFPEIAVLPIVKHSSHALPKWPSSTKNELLSLNIKPFIFNHRIELYDFLLETIKEGDPSRLKHFISYRRKSTTRMAMIHRAVKVSTKMNVFFDEASIGLGAEWRDFFCNQILTAYNVIVIVNDTTLTSISDKLEARLEDNVLLEWELACRNQKRILVVLTSIRAEVAQQRLKDMAHKYRGRYQPIHATDQINKFTGGAALSVDHIFERMAEAPMHVFEKESLLTDFVKKNQTHDGTTERNVKVGGAVLAMTFLCSIQ